MNFSIRRLLRNRDLVWTAALAACSAAAFFAGGQMQDRAPPSAVARLAKIELALATQQEEFDRARINAERRIAALGSRIREMKAAMVRMETWQISLEEIGGGASFQPASAEAAASPADYASAPAGGVDLIAELNLLTARMNLRFEQLREIAGELTAEGSESVFSPSGWPVDTRHITSYQGYRNHPVTGRRHLHKGVDIDGVTGDPIYAVAPGIVTWSGRRSTYGQLVEISHANGYVTRYAHNSLNLVAVGDYVSRGQEIARVGGTGLVSGTHLHFEVHRNGASVNPMEILRKAP